MQNTDYDTEETTTDNVQPESDTTTANGNGNVGRKGGESSQVDAEDTIDFDPEFETDLDDL